MTLKTIIELDPQQNTGPNCAKVIISENIRGGDFIG